MSIPGFYRKTTDKNFWKFGVNLQILCCYQNCTVQGQLKKPEGGKTAQHKICIDCGWKGTRQC
jgi:hypothetical protein